MHQFSHCRNPLVLRDLKKSGGKRYIEREQDFPPLTVIQELVAPWLRVQRCVVNNVVTGLKPGGSGWRVGTSTWRKRGR